MIFGAYNAKLKKKYLRRWITVSRLYCCSESLVALLKACIFINCFTGTIIKKDYAPNKKGKKTKPRNVDRQENDE